MSAVFGGITILDAKSVEVIYDNENLNLINRIKFDSNEYEFGHLIAEKEYLKQSDQMNENFHQVTLGKFMISQQQKFSRNSRICGYHCLYLDMF